MTTTNPIADDAVISAAKKHNKMLDAVEDIDVIARIMKALGNGQDDVDWLVVNWLGERLQKVHEAIDEHQN
ncbi:MAG: hypothetical protein WA864_30135 [Acetobacteraceae bacterium]|jgi:hypothetical protein